ncbi:MAG: glycosyl transferase group 1 [Gemmatimonadetes bacterium]|nr:glycosyl transferase group 1 [Gemmatimonadota bacterium]
MFGLRGLHPDLEVSGFDTSFAEIAPRLASRGHHVTMYCRSSAHSPARRIARAQGIELIYLPSPGGKNLSAVTSTLLAVLHALATRRFDVLFFVNVGMGHHCALARLSGRPVVLNVDGLDWKRGKWGPIARAYFYSAALSAVRFCSRLVTDAEAMRSFYREHFRCDSEMIAYGADVEQSEHPELIADFSVEPDGYYLIVARLVPENSLEEMLEGFRRSRSTRPLIVVGGETYEDAFHARLHSMARSDSRITLVGHVSDQSILKELWCNCHAYLHGHSMGGTNPSLLRAMGYGRCTIALDTVFNREVLADTGQFFSGCDDLAALIDECESAPEVGEALAARARERVLEHYTWEGITDQYERLFCAVTARGDEEPGR